MRIGIHGCYHTPNYGDLLLMQIISSRLQSQGHQVVCPWLPNRFREDLQTPGGRGLRDCLGLDAVVFGGGGYFNDDGTPRSRRRMLRYSVPALGWRCTGTPYTILAVGAGPTMSPSTRRRVRTICRGARQVCVRDIASRDLLLDCGVTNDKLQVTADLAIVIEPQDIPPEANAFAEQHLGPRVPGRRRVCLHPPLMPGQEAETIQLIHGLGRMLHGHDQVQVMWLYDGGGLSLEQFQQATAEVTPAAPVLQIESPWKTTAMLGQMDAVLTTKLHVGIVAWALGVMPCSLSKHGKTKRFFEQIGRSAFQADYTTSPLAYEAWIDCLLHDPSRYHHEDPALRQQVKAQAALNYQHLDTFIQQVTAENNT